MLDRIDMHVHLPRIATSELHKQNEQLETTQQVKARVAKVRDIQQARQQKLNSRLESDKLTAVTELDNNTLQFLETAYHRILRLARTIADMAQCEMIQKEHIAEAIAYRSLDRG